MKIIPLTYKHTKLSLMLFSALLTLSSTAFNLQANDINPHGQLIKINNRNMHIHCMGNQQPTIILDSGTGGFSLEWINIQRAVATHTRICAYDRAGYGWSEASDLPRATKKIAHELYDLLQTANIQGPYIMVGHSFGGFTAQYFARQFNDQVVGMVLIDSSHLEQIYRLPEDTENSSINTANQARRNLVSKAIIHERFPKQYAAQAYKMMNRQSSLMTFREEMATYVISSRQLRNIQHKPMNDIPLHILSRGKRVWPNTPHGDALEATWAYLQNDLNNLSNNSKHIIGKQSEHSIHLDQPALVIQSILEILQTVTNTNLPIGEFSIAQDNATLADSWIPLTFKKIPVHTQYDLVQDDGIMVLQADSNNASSGLSKATMIDLKQYPIIQWSWKISNILPNSDVKRKEGDDHPARLYVIFGYNSDKISFLEKIKYNMATLIHEKKPPLASIAYIWGNNAPMDSIVNSPYTNRLKMFVIENKSSKIGKWVSESRDVYQDYQTAFGEKFGKNPPLVSAIAVMTDTDNTHASTVTWYGDIVFKKRTINRQPLIDNHHN